MPSDWCDAAARPRALTNDDAASRLRRRTAREPFAGKLSAHPLRATGIFVWATSLRRIRAREAGAPRASLGTVDVQVSNP